MTTNPSWNLSRLPSPLGQMLLVTDARHAIRALDFADHESHLQRALREQYGQVDLVGAPAPPAIADALARYFAGDRQALDALPVATRGTPLQE
ncbi:MAG TPA: cysteine methyltransferase, partial [Xanthomonadaceae bacterium]|nr:cysteine methyltransferase [Xanthomonadaceae bacterium]